jgi:hypothetical protein
VAKYNSTILLILIAMVSLAVIVSGCVNTSEPTQKTQPISSPTPIPTKEVKIINIDAQQIVLDENDIKEVLGQDWKASGSRRDDPSCGGSRSCINRGYESFPIYASIEVVVYGSIEEANSVQKSYGEKINIGDIGGMSAQGGGIQIVFVRNNILCRFGFNKGFIIGASETEKAKIENAEMISIEKAYDLAKRQDEKISRVLEMIQ